MSIAEKQILHPDWPGIASEQDYWDNDEPTADFVRAWADATVYDTATGTALREVIPLSRIASVELYHVEYHGLTWRPGQDGGTELGLVCLGSLTDGRWFGLSAWNDYTGWGCQDGSDLRLAATRDDPIRNCLSNEDREALGVSL